MTLHKPNLRVDPIIRFTTKTFKAPAKDKGISHAGTVGRLKVLRMPRLPRLLHGYRCFFIKKTVETIYLILELIVVWKCIFD